MEPDPHANQPTVHAADNHGTSPRLAGRLFVFHNTILQALKDLQPLVVLFSLTVAVASLLRTPFADASTWALAASLGFGWALLFSVLIRLAPPLGAFGSLASIYHLLVDVGVLFGFVALGAALYLLSRVN